jgi:membrane-associated phospholipid phosphatase
MELDKLAFWAMNNSLAEGRAWQWLWAISNNRLFDLVPATGMLLLFYHRGVIKDRENLNRYIAIGILMLVTIVIASQIGKALPIKRPSATFAFPEALRISELVPGVYAKDTASDSFPGDHGLVLLLFAGFVAFFMPRIYGIIAFCMMIMFTMPRLMGGSHWLTDEIVGALAIGVMTLSWVLATPLHGMVLDKIEGWVQRRRTKSSRT